jgi:uncharacterized membrane protein
MSIEAPPPVKALRRYLVAGLLLWVPVGITFLVVRFLVRLMDQTLLLIPVHYRPDELLGIHIPGLGILLAFIVLLVTGMLAANFMGRRLLAVWEGVLDRIPFVRTIYGGAKNFAETVLSGQGKAFNKVLLVQYPRKDVWSLAFKTSEYLGEVQAKTGKDVVCVFVPTTPNPTSGFIIMVPRDEVIELDMEVDQALKMIISLGVVVPRWKHPEQVPDLASKLPGN